MSATKVHTLNATPETIVVEGGTDFCKLSSDFHMSSMAQHSVHAHTHMHAHAHELNKLSVKKKLDF